jgi:hypothetical protein
MHLRHFLLNFELAMTEKKMAHLPYRFVRVRPLRFGETLQTFGFATHDALHLHSLLSRANATFDGIFATNTSMAMMVNYVA